MPSFKTIIDNLFYNMKIKTEDDFCFLRDSSKYFFNYIESITHKEIKTDLIINYCKKKLIDCEKYNEKYNLMNDVFDKYVLKYKNIFNTTLVELIKHHKKKGKILVCRRCFEIGHKINSNICKHKIYDNKILTNKIKKYVLSLNAFDNSDVAENLKQFAEKISIPHSTIMRLYYAINPVTFIKKELNIDTLSSYLFNKTIECYECKYKLFDICRDTNKLWKGNIICDKCWCKHKKERTNTWKLIKKYRKYKCFVCDKQKRYDAERYHFDHINMFDKGDSIYNMVNSGIDIEKIYKEIDKSKLLCISCHHIITLIEKRIGFMRIKKELTYKKNNNLLTEQEHLNKTSEYNVLYNDVMNDIYKKLSLIIKK